MESDGKEISNEQILKVKEEVLEYLDLCRKSKESKKRKKSLEKSLVSFLVRNDISCCTIPLEYGGGKLGHQPMTKKPSVKDYYSALYSLSQKGKDSSNFYEFNRDLEMELNEKNPKYTKRLKIIKE